MRALKWSLGLMVLLVLSAGSAAWAQNTPNVWHPYVGGVNCIQVGDANGNFNCFPGITINPVTGAVGGLAGGGTVSSVTAGAGLTATPSNPIVGTGTIALPNVGPGAGTTCGDTTHSCTVVIDIQGRVSGLTNNVIAGGGGGGTPGGSTTQIQYNNAGSFGGISGATSNGTVVTLTSPVFVTPALGTPVSGVLTNATGLPIGGIVASGTPSSTTFLRGDGTWNTPAGAGTVTTTGSPASGQLSIMSGATSITSSSAITASSGAITATGAITGNSLVSNGSVSGSLTLTNVGGAGFSFIETVGNPAANVSVTTPIALPASNGLPRVATTAGVESWAVLGAAGGGTGTSSTLTGLVRGGSPMTAAEISGDATTSGSNALTLTAVNKRRSCVYDNDSQSATALTNAQITGHGCQVPGDSTLVEVVVSADAGTPSVLLERFRPSASSAADLQSGALATGASGAFACAWSTATTTCPITNIAASGSITLSNTALTKGDTIRVKSATAGGTATRFTVTAWYTVN